MDERAKQTSLTSLNKQIRLIARSAIKLNELIHTTCVAAMQHAFTFGDTSACGRLVDALPLSHRRSLVIDWFDMFSPIGIAKDNKLGNMKAYLRGKEEERAALWNIEGAKATPFYAIDKVAAEPDMPTFQEIHDNIVSFVKRLETKVNGTPATATKPARPGIEDEAERAKALAEVNKLKEAIAQPAPVVLAA